MCFVFGGKVMDSIMDKIAEKISAQDLIRANSQAETAEAARIKQEAEQYRRQLEEIRNNDKDYRQQLDEYMKQNRDYSEDFEDIKDDGDFEGSHTMAYGKTRGSVIFNGEIQGNSTLNLYNANKYFYEDTEIFGGIYVNDNVYIEVYSVNGSKRDKEKITKFLKELGFPKP